MGNKFLSRMEALMSESTLRLQLIASSPRPTPETEAITIEAPNPQDTKLTHSPTSIRPQTDSSSQEETSSSEDDQSLCYVMYSLLPYIKIYSLIKAKLQYLNYNFE